MRIGFIGLGNMGGPICRHLIAKSGEDVAFFDLDPERRRACAEVGGVDTSTLAEAISGADVVFTSLPAPRHMEEVALGPGGIAETARAGATYFDLTTNSPAVVRRVAGELAAKGITMLDAPVSGGPSGAEAGTLSVLVGGDKATFDAHEKLLLSFSAAPTHVGDLTSGTVVKLVNNMIAMCGVAAAAEGLMLGAAAGVDLRKLDAAIRSSTGDSIAYRALADRALSGDYSPAFTLDLAYKDIHLALELADELSVPTPLGAQLHMLMRMARGMGLGASDPTAIMRVYESTQQRELRQW